MEMVRTAATLSTPSSRGLQHYLATSSLHYPVIGSEPIIDHDISKPPKSFRKAMQRPDREILYKAYREEMKALDDKLVLSHNHTQSR